jgi:hypothetical protein
MSSAWFISSNGREEGPLTLDEVRERVAAGALTLDDRVSADRVTWLPAGEVVDATFALPGGVTVLRPSSPAFGLETVKHTPAFPSVEGYEIQGQLGAGGCGVVYRAVQTRLGRPVALKTIRLADGTSADAAARFRREAVALAKLQHPNIVAVHDSGIADGRAFFAMELLAGEDLKQRIDRAGPLDERAALLVARQTAAALANAHAAGIIHRDIKPANLFLVPPPTGFNLPPGVPMVKVTDFGLALTDFECEVTEHQTAKGVLLGTPVYMAPEQFQGSTVDHRADIYSLGCTLYHALSGQPPFLGKTMWELLAKKSAPVQRLGPEVSPGTADLVAAMLAADPNQRPADYAGLLARIDRLLESPQPSEVPPNARRRRGVAVVAVAVAGVVLIGTGAAVWLTGGERAKPPAVEKAAERLPTETRPPAKEVVAPRELYRPGSPFGWRGRLEIVRDAEKLPVLSSGDEFGCELPPQRDFRLAVSLDMADATDAEVAVVTNGSGWAVRLNRSTGAVLGRRTAGTFEPVGPTVPVPAAVSGRPYLGLLLRRIDGTFSAELSGKSLGQAAAGDATYAELLIRPTGGAVRVEGALFEPPAGR